MIELFLSSTASSGSSTWGMIALILVMLIFMYFFMIRPGNKEAKEKEAMMSGLEVGDTVLTTSGFYGVIIDIGEDVVIVEFGSNKNCRIPMQKAAISRTEKPEEAKASAERAQAEAEKKAEKDSKKKSKKSDK